MPCCSPPRARAACSAAPASSAAGACARITKDQLEIEERRKAVRCLAKVDCNWDPEAELALKDKVGMDTGLKVTHPLTGAQVPLWVGNYVLMSYGDGAVMGVPSHDERDFAFAKKYNLPIKQVIDVKGQPYSTDAWQPWYGETGTCIASGAYDGLAQKEAIAAMAAAIVTATNTSVNWKPRRARRGNAFTRPAQTRKAR